MDAVKAIEKTLRFSGQVDWALRLIAALRAKLADDLARLQRGEAPEDVFAAEADTDPAPTRAEGVRGESGERGDRADRERYDRLPRGFDDADFTEILKRPADEVIALICETLGLSPDWPRLAEEAWERAEASPSGSVEGQGSGPASGLSPIGLADPSPDHPPPPRPWRPPGPPTVRFL